MSTTKKRAPRANAPSKNGSPPPRIRGPKNVFRGKIKMAFSIGLTQHGSELMERGTQAAGMSRGDFFDMLLRETRRMDFAELGRAYRKHMAFDQETPTVLHANAEMVGRN